MIIRYHGRNRTYNIGSGARAVPEIARRFLARASAFSLTRDGASIASWDLKR
tara:strand:+ start:762 stop:917 length:156 start_codon:yes stop_codon:yes gene_type:complete